MSQSTGNIVSIVDLAGFGIDLSTEVSYARSSRLLEKMLGVKVSGKSLWHLGQRKCREERDVHKAEKRLGLYHLKKACSQLLNEKEMDSLDYGGDNRNGSGGIKKIIVIQRGRRRKKKGMSWSHEGINNLPVLWGKKLNELWREISKKYEYYR